MRFETSFPAEYQDFGVFCSMFDYGTAVEFTNKFGEKLSGLVIDLYFDANRNVLVQIETETGLRFRAPVADVSLAPSPNSEAA